uniref:Caspase-1-like protein n=1 Tax=Sitophilus oryzae TaxID=7048 RepID=A0A0S1VX44_SITOR|nr:caspase-1-like protein [Sitophilus oryzae]
MDADRCRIRTNSTAEIDSRKSSIGQYPYEPKVVQLEPIVFKPSAELVPDEYERENNKNFAVKIVQLKIDRDAENLYKSLKEELGYNVDRKIIDEAEYGNIELACLDYAKTTKQEVEATNIDGLIMIFAKLALQPKRMSEIWGEFTSDNCPSLADKPKIFLFQTMDKKIGTDGTLKRASYQQLYNSPVEADLLIVYDNYHDQGSMDFLFSFNENIANFAAQEDLLSLITVSKGSSNRPVVISTMTKKFYLLNHEHRGHHLDIVENHNEIKKHLEDIKRYVTEPKPKAQPKVKRNPSRRTNNRPIEQAVPDGVGSIRTPTAERVNKTIKSNKSVEDKPPWRY